MKVLNHELQDAFGEVLYAMSKIDGEVQQAELDTFNKIIKKHSWAKEIAWSFDYENRRNKDPKSSFNRSMNVFKNYGPSKDYPFFVYLVEQIAASHDGIVQEEQAMISQLKSELL